MNGTARDARKVWFRGFENYVSKLHCVVGPKLAIGVPLSTHPRRQNLERNVSSANVQPTASLKSASAEFFASRNRSSNGLWDNQYHLPWRHTSKCCSAVVIPRRHSLAAAVWVLDSIWALIGSLFWEQASPYLWGATVVTQILAFLKNFKPVRPLVPYLGGETRFFHFQIFYHSFI